MNRSVFILLFLIPYLSFSHNEKDSLFSVWNDERRDPAIRIKALNEAMKYYLPNQPDVALDYGMQAYKLAKKHNQKRPEVISGIIMGIAYYDKKEFAKSLYYYDQSLTTSFEVKDNDLTAGIYRNIGILYYDQGYFKKSLHYFKQCFKYADPKGQLYNFTLLHIANSYQKVDNYAMAVQYTRQGIEHAIKYNHHKKLTSNYVGLADLFIDKGDFSEAEKNLNLALKYLKNESDFFDLENSFSKLYLKQGKYALAKKKNELTLSHALKFGNVRHIIAAYSQYAELAAAVGDDDKAILYAEKVLEYGKKEKTLLDLKSISDLLLLLYEKTGNYKKGFALFKFQEAMNDSVNKNVLLQFELSREFEKKTLQDSLKAAEKTKILNLKYNQKLQTQNFFSVAGFTTAALFLIMSVFIYKNYKNKKKINEIISEENKILELKSELSQSHILELLEVIDSALDFIAFSKNETVFSYINHAGKKMLHIDSKHATNYAYDALFDAETVDFINTVAIPECLKNGFFSGEALFLLSDMTKYQVLLNVVSHRDSKNNVTQYSMIARDISDLKEYQAKIEHQNVQLQKVNHELDSFVYSTSHDLRAPLTSVTGIVNILQEEFQNDNTDLQMYLEMIQSAIDRTDDTIKSILEYSKNARVHVKPENINVRETIDEVLKNYQASLLKNGIAVVIIVSEKVPFHNDKMRFELLLHNLIGNAVKFQRQDNPDKKITIDFTNKTAQATLIVQDNGIGIENEFHDRVFDMFFRASNSSPGSGLGLYVVKQISNMINAEVSLESSAENGTKVTINFDNK